MRYTQESILAMINALPSGKNVSIPAHASVIVDGVRMAPWGEQSAEDQKDFLASCTEVQEEYYADGKESGIARKVYKQNCAQRIQITW